MVLIVLCERAKLPKLFCVLISKVSNLRQCGVILKNYLLKKIFTTFESSNFKNFTLQKKKKKKMKNDPWGVSGILVPYQVLRKSNQSGLFHT